MLNMRRMEALQKPKIRFSLSLGEWQVDTTVIFSRDGEFEKNEDFHFAVLDDKKPGDEKFYIVKTNQRLNDFLDSRQVGREC